MGRDDQDFADIAGRLYALPPEEFVAARNAAAKQEKGPLARAIKQLRRPTVAAWLVNLLATHRPHDLDELLNLGDQLRQAQQDLDGARIRELSTLRQNAIRSLVATARELAAEHGKTVRDGPAWEAETTLRTATADPDIAEQVRAGTLVRPAEGNGVGLLAPDAAPTKRPPDQESPEPPTKRGSSAQRKSTTARTSPAARKATAKRESSAEHNLTAEQEPSRQPAKPGTTPSGARAKLRVIPGGRLDSLRTTTGGARGDSPSAADRGAADATQALADAEQQLAAATAEETAATRRLDEIGAALEKVREQERTLRSQQSAVERERRRAARRRAAAQRSVSDARRRLRSR